MGISFPSVIEYDGKVIVMYNNGIPPSGVPPAQWVRWSSDGGQTWTAPIRPFPRHVGRNGLISFVVDSNNTLHVFFPERIQMNINGGYAEDHGMWHSTFIASHWSEPESVVDKVLIAGQIEDPDALSFDPFNARVVISQGNVVLVTWRTDPGRADNGVWYSYITLDTPELPVVPLLTISTSPETTSKTAIPEITGTPSSISLQPGQDHNSSLIFSKDYPKSLPNPGMYIAIGLVPVLLLTFMVILIQVRHRFSHH
jgi:hypothetical protein